MTYLQAIVALFAIVDPIGNIPMFMHVAERVPDGQAQKAFNTAVGVGAVILLVFAFAGNVILEHLFHINLADLKVAGGILLLITAIDNLLFGLLKKEPKDDQKRSATEMGCVPLACPFLAGPGAMVTCLATFEQSGPVAAGASITVVFAILWLVLRFVEPIHRILGRLICTAISKIMLVFIASIGVHMIMTGLQHYFTSPQ